MACSYCGQNYCTGNCLSGQVQGTAYQGQAGQIIFQNPGLAAQGMGGGILQLGGSTYNPVDTALYNFLETIADKDDTAACISFLEKQRATHIRQVQEIERLQKQHKEDLEKAEQEFLSKCNKYRPSITEELMSRIKGLKAFF